MKNILIFLFFLLSTEIQTASDRKPHLSLKTLTPQQAAQIKHYFELFTEHLNKKSEHKLTLDSRISAKDNRTQLCLILDCFDNERTLKIFEKQLPLATMQKSRRLNIAILRDPLFFNNFNIPLFLAKTELLTEREKATSIEINAHPLLGILTLKKRILNDQSQTTVTVDRLAETVSLKHFCALYSGLFLNLSSMKDFTDHYSVVIIPYEIASLQFNQEDLCQKVTRIATPTQKIGSTMSIFNNPTLLTLPHTFNNLTKAEALKLFNQYYGQIILRHENEKDFDFPLRDFGNRFTLCMLQGEKVVAKKGFLQSEQQWFQIPYHDIKALEASTSKKDSLALLDRLIQTQKMQFLKSYTASKDKLLKEAEDLTKKIPTAIQIKRENFLLRQMWNEAPDEFKSSKKTYAQWYRENLPILYRQNENAWKQLWIDNNNPEESWYLKISENVKENRHHYSLYATQGDKPPFHYYKFTKTEKPLPTLTQGLKQIRARQRSIKDELRTINNLCLTT